MAELLADPAVITTDDVVAAFQGYDAIRRSRSQKVVTSSKENAEVLCLSYPGIMDDGEKLKQTWRERFKWLWDIDLQEQADNAKKVMHEEMRKAK